MNNNFLCPACGFNLDFAPWNRESPSDEICPCCWIQFGLDDAVPDANQRPEVYRRWREEWINERMPWRGKRSPPLGWDPGVQVQRVK